MNDRPILFSAPMIRALLEGRKTQTRRVLKKPAWAQDDGWPDKVMDEQDLDGTLSWFSRETGCLAQLPIPQPGDRLWAKEAWNAFTFSEDGECAWPTDTIPTAKDMREIKEIAYRYDTQVVYRESDRARKWFADQKWRPSIHMPRWASRLTLTVTDVRVQRVQEISYIDTCAEGADCETCAAMGQSACYRKGCGDSRKAFRDLWDSLNAKRGFGWNENPWVAAYTFTVHRQNIDQMKIRAPRR